MQTQTDTVTKETLLAAARAESKQRFGRLDWQWIAEVLATIAADAIAQQSHGYSRGGNPRA